MDTIDKVKKILNDLIASLQKARLYSTDHLIFKNSIDSIYKSLQDVLREKGELVIGIVSGEFAFEKEIFFELSNFDLAKKAIVFLQEKGIEKIVFYPHLNEDELYMFITFLVNPLREQIKMNLDGYLITLGIKNIAVGKIKVPDSISMKAAEPINYLSIYENYLKVFSEYTQAILNNRVADFSTLKITMTEIMEHLCLEHQKILKLTVMKKQGITALPHSVNVSILTIYFSFKLGFSKRDILDMGIAALFHDMGKIYIGRRIFGKENKLAEKESMDIKSHTQWGAEILLKYVDTLGVLPVLVSFEHHLRYDFKGYPKLSFRYKPHIASFIVSICDIYDALSQRMSPKYNYPADAIYSLMMKEGGKAFDPDLLGIFFRIIGVWPIGTIVLLSDSSVAIVRQENEEDIFAPRVEIIYPQDRREVIDLKDRKEDLKIERALNPFTEGKAYLHLV